MRKVHWTELNTLFDMDQMSAALVHDAVPSAQQRQTLHDDPQNQASDSLAMRRCRASGREAEIKMRGVKGRSAGWATSLSQMWLRCDTQSGRRGFFSTAASTATSALTWPLPHHLRHIFVGKR